MSRREPVDYLLNGVVITMDGSNRIIREGCVAVHNGRILAVGRKSDIEEKYKPDRALGGPDCFVTPGFIDCHNHLAQALVREFGMEDLPNIYRVYIPCETAMDADDARISAGVMISQLLRAGVTTVAETTCTAVHEDMIAETIMQSGMRAVMARGQGDRKTTFASNYDQVNCKTTHKDDPGKLVEDLARCEEFIKQWQAKGDGRLIPWIHTMGLPACSDERFLRTRELAEKYNTGVTTHINRDREEIEISIATHGERPLEHLNTIGALWPGYVAIHAMLTTDREIQMLAANRAKVAHSPVACTDIISAVTRVVSMRSAGVTVGLGCDTVINDIIKVMRIAFIMHTQANGIPLYDPVSFTTEHAFEMATREAAKTLGLEQEIGSLETGKKADVVVMDANNVRLSPHHNPIGVIVQYGTGTDVSDVLVDGKQVVENGQLVNLDEAVVLEEARNLSDRLRPALEARRYRPLTQYSTVC